MSKADVLTLVQTFALEQADAGTISRFYDDLVRATADMATLAQASTLAVTLEQASFTLPDEAMRLLHVFYADRMLDRMRLLDLEALSAQWRDHVGLPVAYATEHETERTFRLYPKPALPSATYDPLLGMPFGAGMPSYSVLVIWSNFQDVPEWLELGVMLKILVREFQREARHRDEAFARGCEQLAQVCDALLGRT